jgi:hypothetical protein
VGLLYEAEVRWLCWGVGYLTKGITDDFVQFRAVEIRKHVWVFQGSGMQVKDRSSLWGMCDVGRQSMKRTDLSFKSL